jgi:subtilase family serine protease
VALAAVLLAVSAVPASAGAATTTSAVPRGLHAEHVCSGARAGFRSCDAIVLSRTDATAGSDELRPNATSTPAGYGPADLQGAYGLSGTGGSGRTIAIVDAYDAPTAAADLAKYRSTFGLPALQSGQFRKVNQTGGTSLPATNASWAQETSLDLDMASAACPSCNILLVEASSASSANLATAARTAAATSGVVAVSNSYGGPEDTIYASSYSRSGVWFTASSGDSGYGVSSPASYSSVVAVGGTSLTVNSSHVRTAESVWSGAGAGCSASAAKPSWQTDTGCSRRTVADVSAVADPQTGVAVYDSTPYQGSSGWMVFGGTSASAPLIAGIHARAGTTGSNASSLYASRGSLFDVVGGSDGSCSPAYLCTGVTGFDGPSGLGSPNGFAGF